MVDLPRRTVRRPGPPPIHLTRMIANLVVHSVVRLHVRAILPFTRFAFTPIPSTSLRPIIPRPGHRVCRILGGLQHSGVPQGVCTGHLSAFPPDRGWKTRAKPDKHRVRFHSFDISSHYTDTDVHSRGFSGSFSLSFDISGSPPAA